jgi:hypothetical protein
MAKVDVYSPVYREEHVLWKLTNGNHIGGLLELHRLVVNETTFGVDDHVWIHWTVLALAVGGRAGRNNITTVSI